MFQTPLPLFVWFLLGSTSALELKAAEEGSCLRNVPYLTDLDPVWVSTLQYMNGGNKLFLYTQASHHPEFRGMREYELYYGACLVRNTSFADGTGSAFGFGRLLRSFDVKVVTPGVFTFVPKNVPRGTSGGSYTVRATFTDYKTFVVFTGCVEASNQRIYGVVSLAPQLGEASEKLVEDHVVSLKFRRENVVFLRYGNCEKLEEILGVRGRQGDSYGELGYKKAGMGSGGYDTRVTHSHKSLRDGVSGVRPRTLRHHPVTVGPPFEVPTRRSAMDGDERTPDGVTTSVP